MKRGQIYYVRSNCREEGSEQRGGVSHAIRKSDIHRESRLWQ